MMPELNLPNSLVVDSQKLLNQLKDSGESYKKQENWGMLEEVMYLHKYVETHQKNGKVTVTQMQLIDAGIL